MEKSAESLSWDEWRKAKEEQYLGEDGKPLPAQMRQIIAYYGRANWPACGHYQARKEEIK